jgi:hypothetical protein
MHISWKRAWSKRRLVVQRAVLYAMTIKIIKAVGHWRAWSSSETGLPMLLDWLRMRLRLWAKRTVDIIMGCASDGIGHWKICWSELGYGNWHPRPLSDNGSGSCDKLSVMGLLFHPQDLHGPRAILSKGEEKNEGNMAERGGKWSLWVSAKSEKFCFIGRQGWLPLVWSNPSVSHFLHGFFFLSCSLLCSILLFFLYSIIISSPVGTVENAPQPILCYSFVLLLNFRCKTRSENVFGFEGVNVSVCVCVYVCENVCVCECVFSFKFHSAQSSEEQ